MELKVFGMGCAKCKKLLEATKQAVEQSGVEAEVIYVDEMVDIMQAGIMSTPALSINGVVKSTGKLLKVDEIKQLISDMQ